MIFAILGKVSIFLGGTRNRVVHGCWLEFDACLGRAVFHKHIITSFTVFLCTMWVVSSLNMQKARNVTNSASSKSVFYIVTCTKIPFTGCVRLKKRDGIYAASWSSGCTNTILERQHVSKASS